MNMRLSLVINPPEDAADHHQFIHVELPIQITKMDADNFLVVFSVLMILAGSVIHRNLDRQLVKDLFDLAKTC